MEITGDPRTSQSEQAKAKQYARVPDPEDVTAWVLVQKDFSIPVAHLTDAEREAFDIPDEAVTDRGRVKFEEGDELPASAGVSAMRLDAGMSGSSVAALDDTGEIIAGGMTASNDPALGQQTRRIVGQWRAENGIQRRNVTLYACSQCDAEFETEQALQSHQQTHTETAESESEAKGDLPDPSTLSGEELAALDYSELRGLASATDGVDGNAGAEEIRRGLADAFDIAYSGGTDSNESRQYTTMTDKRATGSAQATGSESEQESEGGE